MGAVRQPALWMIQGNFSSCKVWIPIIQALQMQGVQNR